MTAAPKRDVPTAPGKRSWTPELLAAAEPGRRNRRTIDGVLLAVGAFLTGLAGVIAAQTPETDEDVAQALVTVLGWAGALWRAAFLAALLLALVIVLDVLLRRRWFLARDVVLALLLVGVASTLLGRWVEADWFVIEADIWSRWGFPELRLACVAAVFAVAGPELVRSVRVLAAWLVPLAALGAVVLEAALPSSILGALSLGLGAGALVRLAFGTAAAVPPAEDIRRALASLGVDVGDLRAATQQRRGAALYVGHDSSGGPLKVRVLGRDAQDTQRLARRWRALAYRDPPRSVGEGRLEQVEHEALATLMAAQAGVRVPEVVCAALGPEGDALVVTRQPDLEPFESAAPEQVSDETLVALWEQVARLHAAGISHGRLNASNVLLLDDGPLLVDFSAATLGAPRSALDIDVAELLVACTVLVGPERALGKAVEAGWGDAVARVLPYLQRAALTPHLRDLAHAHEVGLKDLRAAAAEATGQKVPELAPMRRVRIQDLLVTALVAFAAYLLITQLAEIGFDTIADELRDADIPWVVVGLVIAQLTFVAQAVSLQGAVVPQLALLPCVVLQSAIKFINLIVPSSAGRIAINVRFLQKMGVPTEQALVSGAVDGVSEEVVQILLILATIPFVDIAIDSSELKVSAPDGRLVGAIVIALVGVIAVFLGIPKLRARVLPPVKRALSALWFVARTRRKRLQLFGGNVAAEVLFALTLGAVCHAYGVDLDLAELLFVNTTASAFAGLMPVPGGIGAAEAAITVGLVALGVDESTAFAIAFTHRLCTYYLPPIWGYFSLRWLTRKGYV
ncbi:MAG: lysylphosphatidylglycerol synthase transmembrane domain-containing protein [Thermoleophilaceae bacterium]